MLGLNYVIHVVVNEKKVNALTKVDLFLNYCMFLVKLLDEFLFISTLVGTRGGCGKRRDKMLKSFKMKIIELNLNVIIL